MDTRSRAARHLMAGRPMTHEEAENMIQAALDQHAHRLAEKIRAENPDRTPDWSAGTDWAADLIDPEVGS